MSAPVMVWSSSSLTTPSLPSAIFSLKMRIAARMRAAIRIFNEKMADGSDGVVSEEELQTITGADIPELDEDALVMA